MNGKVGQAIKKAKELYAKLLQRRFIEVTTKGNRYVWY